MDAYVDACGWRKHPATWDFDEIEGRGEDDE
jgi:hypothetical protein